MCLLNDIHSRRHHIVIQNKNGYQPLNSHNSLPIPPKTDSCAVRPKKHYEITVTVRGCQ